MNIKMKKLDAQQRATLWDLFDPGGLNGDFRHTWETQQITKSDWADHWGDPCEWYVKGCVVCDRWQLWTDITGEVIEYEAHEDDCECDECAVDESAV